MNPQHHFYDFKFGLENSGFFEIKIENDSIYQNAKFQNGNEIYENPFFLKIEDDRIVAFRKGAGEWINLSTYGENHFPGSAFPLLLPLVKNHLEYFQINEESGQVAGLTILERAGNTISEYRDQKLLRSFEMLNNFPIKINWGGAVSNLKKSFAEAVAGSPIQNNL